MVRHHDAPRRLPWQKSKGVQLDLAGLDPEPDGLPSIADAQSLPCVAPSVSVVKEALVPVLGDRPVPAAQLAIQLLDEDTHNPRTEFPDAELDELAEDIREHGVLQPIVVHAADSNGRHLIHFGAKRLRAARRAGMSAAQLDTAIIAAIAMVKLSGSKGDIW